MTNPQTWKLLKTKDISPSKWFPLEERTYELPDGSIVDDFSVTTLTDVAMIIPTKASERVTTFVMKNAQVTEKQNFDTNENIILEYVSFEEVDEMIISGEINTAPTITAWYLLKLKHRELLSSK